MAQPDVYHNTQFISPQQLISCNIHFQLELQQYTYHPNMQNLSSNCKDENYNFLQLPKYLSFNPSKSKESDFYRKLQQYANDKYWSSQECNIFGIFSHYLFYINTSILVIG